MAEPAPMPAVDLPPELIVDSTIVAAWFLPDEPSAVAERILSALSEVRLSAPMLLKAEFANVLTRAFRRRRMDDKLLDRLLDDFDRLPIRYETLSLHTAELVRGALRHQQTPYAFVYLDLAVRTRLPLATLDPDLAAAAERAGLAVISA
jgi:predicted nucleic acid-binding protein